MSSSSLSSLNFLVASKKLEMFFEQQIQLENDEFEAIIKWIENNTDLFIEQENEAAAKKRRVRRVNTPDYWATAYGKILKDPALRDFNSYIARKFRLRFRVSVDVFELLVSECIDHNVFERKYIGKIPIEFKVLACLRILGRDLVADDVAWESGIAESTIHPMFSQFCKGMNDKLFDKYIKFPQGAELAEIKEQYAKLGFPGAIGSMDCTHIGWEKCPHELHNICKNGKYDQPTLVFQVMVDHSRKVHHVSCVYTGTTSDKNITKHDTLPNALIGDMYKDEVFYTYTADGTRIEWHGAYVIVDGGYAKYAVFINPMNDRFGQNEVMWSEFLESVRKDIECFFGILKARFRFFRNSIQYHNPVLLEDAFRTACIIHNMLHAADGLNRFDWHTMSPDGEVSQEHLLPEDEAIVRPTPFQRNGRVVETRAHLPAYNYHPLRSALVQHFNYMYVRGKIQWPRQMSYRLRNLYPVDPTTVREVLGIAEFQRRAEAELLRHLYKQPSPLRRRDMMGFYTRTIGMGLFSRVKLRKDDRIVYFVGDIVNREQHEANDCGYTILLSNKGNGEFLDCYNAYTEGRCLASAANSPKGCLNSVSQTLAVANAYCMRGKSHGQWKVSLVALCAIDSGVEIVWDYGNEYEFPGFV